MLGDLERNILPPDTSVVREILAKCLFNARRKDFATENRRRWLRQFFPKRLISPHPSPSVRDYSRPLLQHRRLSACIGGCKSFCPLTLVLSPRGARGFAELGGEALAPPSAYKGGDHTPPLTQAQPDGGWEGLVLARPLLQHRRLSACIGGEGFCPLTLALSPRGARGFGEFAELGGLGGFAGCSRSENVVDSGMEIPNYRPLELPSSRATVLSRGKIPSPSFNSLPLDGGG